MPPASGSKQTIPGWQRPAAWGLGRLSDDGTVQFERVNVAWSLLPAVVVATLCGHVSGSGAYPLTVVDLDRAIALLAPADFATFMPHPSLAALRALRADLDDDDQAVVVYAGDLADPTDDPAVRALLDAVRVEQERGEVQQ